MNKKGFTLVELLAVIVILSIILVIAVPSVNRYIKQSKEKAYKVQISELLDAVESYANMNNEILPENDDEVIKITLGQLKIEGIVKNDTKNPYNDKFFDDTLTFIIKKKGNRYTYEIDEDTIKVRETTNNSPSIKLTGNTVVYYSINSSYQEEGSSAYDYNGKVISDVNVDSSSLDMSVKGVYYIKYTATDSYGTTTTVYRNVVVRDGAVSNLVSGQVYYYNPVTNVKCTSAEAVSVAGTKTGCMKWYSILDNGTSDNITLLLDHNTTATVAWASSNTNANGPVEVKTQLESDTSSWNSTIKNTARLIEASEIAKITGNAIWTAADKYYYYFHNNTQTQYKGDAGTNKYAWLIDNTVDCTKYGCNVADSSTLGYWTNTAYSGNSIYAWHVYCNGSLGNSGVGSTGFLGVRPVITVSRSILR